MTPIIGTTARIKKILALVSLLLSLVVAVFSALTLGIDAISAQRRRPEVSKENVLFLGAFSRSQGITTDGEYFYFSSKYGLIKTQLDATTRVELNALAIPRELERSYSIEHIGGISYCRQNHRIYAGLEDSKVWQYPIVASYDADTLEFTGEYYILDNSVHTRGMPWVAVDNDNGLLITADHSREARNLVFYDINDGMKQVKTVALSQTVERIQGAEMYNGLLYAATNDGTQAVYEIDPRCGSVRKYFDRNLTNGSEGEGITVLETPDGALFHAIDMGPLFINAFVRHYAPVQ